jgi:outer membrane protein TolC
MNNFRILCLTTTLTCASCSVGPNFKLPEVLMPSKWKNGGRTSTADIPVPGEWWKLFGSAELNRLEERALENNLQLRSALARVETARALVGVQQASWFPYLNNRDAMQYERLSSSSFGANLPPGVSLPALQRRRFQNLLEEGWEIDLWGRVRRSVEGSKAAQMGAMETLSARRLTIASEVARLFFLAHSLDRQIDVVISTQTWREEALKLQESRFKGGLANEMDVARARTELEHAVIWQHWNGSGAMLKTPSRSSAARSLPISASSKTPTCRIRQKCPAECLPRCCSVVQTFALRSRACARPTPR